MRSQLRSAHLGTHRFARLATLLACLLVPSLAAATFTFDTRYLSDQPVPGGSPFDPSSFAGIGNGRINANGQIAFFANVTRPVQIGQPFVTRPEIFSEGAGSIGNAAPVVRVGDPIVGAPAGVTYSSFGVATITDAGNVGFNGRRSDFPTPPSTITPYAGESFFMTSPAAPGQPRMVLSAVDEPVAALGGTAVSRISGTTRLTSQGEFIRSVGLDFVEVTSPEGTQLLPGDSALVTGNASGITRVVVDPDLQRYPSMSPSETLRSDLIDPSWIANPRGEVAVLRVIEPNGGGPNRVALFSEAAGSIGDPIEVVSSGDLAPQLGPNATYDVIGASGLIPMLNDAGQHLFGASYLVNEGPGEVVSFAVLSDSIDTPGHPGQPGVVWRSGQPAPGLAAGYQLETADGLMQPLLGEGGHVAIVNSEATFRFQQGEIIDGKIGIWRHDPGDPDQLELTYLLRRNATDTAELGFVNDEPLPAGNYEAFVQERHLNARGQLAFDVNFHTEEFFDDRPPSTPVAGNTIYATDLLGNVQIVARTGQLFDVSDDPNATDLRTFDRVRLNGLTDGGELLFRAAFTDGSSGLFIAVLDGIPGDFNLDGFVDAADYTVWRDGQGTTFTPGDYDVWAANFGATAPASSAAVPEPTTGLLVLFAICLRSQSRCRDSAW